MGVFQIQQTEYSRTQENKFEDRSIENIQSESQKEKKL